MLLAFAAGVNACGAVGIALAQQMVTKYKANINAALRELDIVVVHRSYSSSTVLALNSTPN